MDYTRYLPDSSDALSRLEWWVYVTAAICGALAITLPFVARGISHHRGSLVQAALQKMVEERDAKVAAAHEDARQARQEAARLKEQLAPRPVTKEQAQIISTGLAMFRGERMTIFAVETPETLAFAQALQAAFVAAGLSVELDSGQILGEAHRGLTVKFSKHKLKFVDAIGAALRSAKIIDGPIEASMWSNPDLVLLHVWPK